MSDNERSFLTPEQFPDPQDTMLRDIINAENDVIDARNDAFYAANLFDADALIAAKMYDPWKLDHPMNIEYEVLSQQFRAEYALQQTAYGRFKLLMNRGYFPYIRSLDLEKTRDARNPKVLDHMVEEYQELRDALTSEGKITRELPRETSGREIHFRPPARIRESEGGLRDAVSEWAIGVRNRPLIRFEKDGYYVTITKRMTFSVPAKLALELTEGVTGETRNIQDSDSMRYMEIMLDENDPSVTPIRTLYYVTKTKIGSEKLALS